MTGVSKIKRCQMVSLVLALAVMMVQRGHSAETVFQTIGMAYDLHSEQPLYSETHCVSSDARKREVIYRNADEQLIAHKIVNYETGPTTPSFVQHNFYSGELVAVRFQQDKLMMTAGEANRERSAEVATSVPEADVPLVIDAGFDVFVTDHWDSLVAGQSRHFLFPFPARSRLVELRIQAASCSYETATDQCFRLELSNWLLSKLVDPIELGYDANLKRLARFRGLSNISDDQGEGLVVDIRYQYQGVLAQVCALRETRPAGTGPDLVGVLRGNDRGSL